MKRAMITGAATVHTVYIVHCNDELHGESTLVISNERMKWYRDSLRDMGDNDTIEDALCYATDHAEIISYKKENRYCCCIKDPSTLADRCNIITSWVNHGNLPFTSKDIRQMSREPILFCNKNKIVEAVNAEKIVAVDGLGVINKDDLDSLEDL